MKKKNQKRKNKKKAEKGRKAVVKLILPEESASKTTLKLMAEIEKLALKIEKQNHLISLQLQDMSEPAEKIGEKLVRERGILEVLRVRLDQKRFEFEESQIADAELELEQIRKQHVRLQAEKAKSKKVLYEKLCELYPAAEAKRLLKDDNFRYKCPITAPILKSIEEVEESLRESEERVNALRASFYMNGTPRKRNEANGKRAESNGKRAETNGRRTEPNGKHDPAVEANALAA